MQTRRFLTVTMFFLGIALTAAFMSAATTGVRAQQETDNPATLLEQAAAREAERNPDTAEGSFEIPSSIIITAPLFIGVDDVAVSTYRIDPDTTNAYPAFTGFQIWGAAYDPDNNIVYFNNGSTLYEWQVGGSISTLGTIVDSGGATQAMVSLAFYDGTLYSTKNIANEAVWTIDPNTLIATVYIDYTDADYDFGGLAIDPNTGTIYGTNDDTTPFGSGLYQINLDGTATQIAPYPVGQTDIDGLAVSDDGYAYLIIDEPGDIFVYDFGINDYTTPIPNPWASSEVFSGGTWFYETGSRIELNKTVGTSPSECATTDMIEVGPGTDVYYCYEVTNSTQVTLTLHDLVDSELGSILTGFPYSLTPGASAFLTTTTNILTTTVNTATWTAYNPGPSDVYSATDTATVVVIIPPPAIEVAPSALSSTQPADAVTTWNLVISNTGVLPLHWNIYEGAPLLIPYNTTPSVAVPVPIVQVTSPSECASYENYAGAEPLGYAEICLGITEVQPAEVSSFDPTSTAYALDIGFVSDNFVSHVLNDFPGQTVIGPNTQTIFAMDFDPTGTILYALDNTSRELGTLDLTSGMFTPIAVVSGIPATDNMSGLTIDPMNGDAYVSGLDPAGTLMTLYSMDLSTAVATPIGSDASVGLLIDIAIGPQGIIYGHDITSDSIYTIDKTTGAATVVGPTGVNSNFAQGMDFDNQDGTLYAYTYQGSGANVYGTIDLATGTLTPLASSNPQGEFEGATQTTSIPPSGCMVPFANPWVSVSPITGTTTAGSASNVDVTFDSTGLSEGVYTATLCINSDDPVTPLVTVPLTLTVVPFSYGVDLSGNQAISATAGTTVTYVMALTNTGNTTDTFDLSATGIWTATLSEVSLTLGAGETVTFTVEVVIPSSVGDGEMDVTTVTATSQNDALVMDSATLTTTALVPDPKPESFELYLPIIFNP